MTNLATEFHSWIMSRAMMLRHAIEGCTVEAPDAEHVVLTTEKAVAHVNFYELDPGMPEVIELNIVPADDPDNPTFFLHFEMDDLDHAKQLFGELTDTLAQLTAQKVTKILLTCTSAMTTTFFARKLQEVAGTLSLDFEFEATNITRALEVAGDYTAVMLAPQVHMRRAEMVERHPDLVVFEIPGAVFGSYDAGTALRMLLNALSENALAARLEQADTRIVRRLDNDKCVLVISGVYGVGNALYKYRIYSHGEAVLDGMTERPVRDRRTDALEGVEQDVKGILAGLRVQGHSLEELDAIGIAIPGVVDGSRARMVTSTGEPHDFTCLSELLGVPVFVDNNANAAAVGCYVSQDGHESVALHRQPTGYTVGGQGLVVDGRLVRGAHGLAGEMGYLVRQMGVRDRLDERAWTSEGMRELVSTYLMMEIAVASPEVIYVAVDLLPDMDELRAELARWLPEGTVPELVHVCDYHERVIVGEYALCLNALRQAEAAEG